MEDLKNLGILPGHIIKILKSTKLYSDKLVKINKDQNIDANYNIKNMD